MRRPDFLCAIWGLFVKNPFKPQKIIPCTLNILSTRPHYEIPFCSFFAVVTVDSASAAMITFVDRTEFTTGDVTFSLTDLGTTDWAYWNTSDNPATGAAANSMNGGTSIGTVTATGTGTTVRGTSNANTTNNFSFTNGTSTASGTASDVTGVFNSKLGTNGEGIQLSFILPDAGQAYDIRVWTAAFGTRFAQVTGTLSGAASYASGNTGGIGTNTGEVNFYGDSVNPKEEYLYHFTVTPDANNDVFTFGISNQNINNPNSHILISAASIAAVPEPSSFALVFVALSALVFLRSR